MFYVQLVKTRRRLELLLEDLPCEYDPWDYYETSDQLLEPLLLCYESLVISLSLKDNRTEFSVTFIDNIFSNHVDLGCLLMVGLPT